ncbi:MAG: metalloregulator ArsR/SmtB family transcription factor [Rhizobiaceae bacterium]|nr:metalloregulator ArsR/SmtB family transcription factor [Rhizobiaceae bacterium]MCV0408083.1 metalloregulator ArsR/SmtB family transcription factor [Rhizobiaceae bacterium]
MNVLAEPIKEGLDAAPRFAALAHPARLKILRHLACRDACCCKDVVERLDLAQSTVSQHLKILVEAGLVTYRPERPRSRYALDRAALTELSRDLDDLVRFCCAPR